MKNHHLNASLSGFLTTAGFVLLAFPVYLQAAWIFSSVSQPGHPDAVESFSSFIPGFLNLQQAAITGFIFSVLALMAGLVSMLLWRKFRRSTTLLVVISGLMMMLNLFQMM